MKIQSLPLPRPLWYHSSIFILCSGRAVSWRTIRMQTGDQFQVVTLNFRELFPEDHPTRQLNECASTMEGKKNPEDRQAKRNAEQEAAKSDLAFTYDPPVGRLYLSCRASNLPFCRERIRDGVSYRIYRKYGCASCPARAQCVGPKARSKELSISSPRLAEIVANKELRAPPYGSRPSGQKHIAYPLALQMREKLKSVHGKKIYAHRFPVVRRHHWSDQSYSRRA